MPSPTNPASPVPASLRLWPGLALAVVIVAARYLVPLAVPGAFGPGILVGLVGGLLTALWWLFFSRAPWGERLAFPAVAALVLFATSRLVHPSLSGGMMGMLVLIYSLPALGLALVVGAALAPAIASLRRRFVVPVLFALACAPLLLLRTDGMMGETGSQFAWRWTPSAEQRLLAQGSGSPRPGPVSSTHTAATGTPAPVPAIWPGFRGPERDGVVRGVRLAADWEKSPPQLLWRRPVGPAWSSFAVRGDRCYTQEQRGEDELVSCYQLATGDPVWQHRDPVRFWESNAGAGPRATPTLAGAQVFTLGGTGRLNALDADTGAVLWSRDAGGDCGTRTPTWGYSGSPLVVGDLVIVAASGRLAAYDAATGQPRWKGPERAGAYSSPHAATIAGVPQVLLGSGSGLTSVAPTNGAVLWEHAWSGAAIVQPIALPDGDLLAGVAGPTGGVGLRRLAVTHSGDSWQVEARWTSAGLKPYFNDSVVHRDHAYGFDGALLACVSLSDGKRQWKDGRYGSGQFLLVADSDLLLVLAETGGLALVEAKPTGFREVGRAAAITGKTWNHPVLAGDVLLVRNAEEMAAFRLARATE